MDSMDYQMESPSIPPLHYNGPPSPPRRCPYGFLPNSNLYSGAGGSQFRNPYLTQNGLSFVPSPAYSNRQLVWSQVTYPLLPPPTPSTHINNPAHYAHFSAESYARGPAEQQSLQSTNMAENAGDESNLSRSWQSNPYETEPPNQSDSSENERSSSAGSDTSANGIVQDRPATNVDSRPNQHVLPPILSSYERSAHSLRPPSFQDRGRQSMEERTNQEPRTVNHSFATFVSHHRPTLHAGEGSGSRPLRPSSSQRERLSNVEYPHRRQRSSESSIAHDLYTDEAFMLTLRNDPAVEAYLDRHVPPLQNEETLRMDDPARLENTAFRMRILRELMSQSSRIPPKKSGASKSSIESLVKVPIAELKEDDRTCQICYNDYGVENPEGVVEFPIRLPKCKHTFGEICLKKWLEDKSTCPYCRDQLPSDTQRARRALIERRRNESLRDMADSSTRQATMLSGPLTGRSTDPADEASREIARQRRMERDERIVALAMARETSRQDAFNRTASRRARGRGGSGSGRVPQQVDFTRAANSMRTATAADSQQRPMRIPVGPASEAYAQNQSNISFSDRTIGHMHNTRGGTSVGPARLPTSSSFHEAYTPATISQAQTSFNGFNPYAAPYAPAADPTYNGGAPHQDRDYRQYQRGYAANYTSNGYGTGTGTNRFQYPGSGNFPDDFDSFPSFFSNTFSNSGPGFPLVSSYTPEGIQAVEAEGERRTLMSMDRDSQDMLAGQPSTERQTTGNESTYLTSDNNWTHRQELPRTRDAYALDWAMERQRQRHIQEHQREIHGAQGNYLEDRFPGSMPPPPPPPTMTHGNPSTESSNLQNENRENPFPDDNAWPANYE